MSDRADRLAATCSPTTARCCWSTGGTRAALGRDRQRRRRPPGRAGTCTRSATGGSATPAGRSARGRTPGAATASSSPRTACAASQIVDLGHFPPRVRRRRRRPRDVVAASGVTAVLAHNDLVALGILDRLRSRGVASRRTCRSSGTTTPGRDPRSRPRSRRSPSRSRGWAARRSTGCSTAPRTEPRRRAPAVELAGRAPRPLACAGRVRTEARAPERTADESGTR